MAQYYSTFCKQRIFFILGYDGHICHFQNLAVLSCVATNMGYVDIAIIRHILTPLGRYLQGQYPGQMEFLILFSFFLSSFGKIGYPHGKD